jgi:hypothetical protein
VSIRAHRRRISTVVGAVLLAAGLFAIVIAIRAQKHAPQPPASAASPVSVIPSASEFPSPPHAPATASPKTPPNRATASAKTSGPILSRSLPMHLAVPAIGVDSDLDRIGLDATGKIQTPPLARDSHPYWLTVSPAPGQLGPATIVGHVDSATNGPAVFFRLGDLRQRDTISVTRADGVVAVFQVEKIVEYPKAQFPTHAVYGNTDNAALRLITCGGIFNPSVRSYEDNIVAYASLVSTHHG